MTAIEARERVAKGAALLDAHRPGWATVIDVGRLEIANSYFCVMGQLKSADRAGSWEAVLPSVNDNAEAWGLFWSPPYVEFDSWKAEHLRGYALLQDAWIEAIADRVVIGAKDKTEAVTV